LPDFTLAADGDTFTVHASAQARQGQLVGTGADGLVRFGFNQHAWPWQRSMYDQAGAKAMRMGGAGYARFKRDNAYPGPKWYPGSDFWNEIIQTCVDNACADGFDVVLCLINPNYGPGDERWGEFCTAVAQANVKNVDRVYLEISNEPNWTGPVTGAEYAVILQQSAAAIRAVDARLRIAAPTINATYNTLAQKFVVDLMATPGIEKCFDVGSFHPYYQTPERCYWRELIPFIDRVETPANAAGRASLEYIATEVGWSNAIYWLADPTVENLGSIGNTHLQNVEVIADYYSRWIPIARATKKMRLITFYALMDEEAPGSDPTFRNVQGHFGVWNEWRSALKPGGLVCKDILAHVHAATGAQMFNRMDLWTGNRFVRLDLPGTQRLIAWSLGGARNDQIAVNATAACTLSVNVAGDPANAIKYQLTAGSSFVPVSLKSRSIIIAADGPITFPEFVNPQSSLLPVPVPVPV
jgi:hypothetical protein